MGQKKENNPIWTTHFACWCSTLWRFELLLSGGFFVIFLECSLSEKFNKIRQSKFVCTVYCVKFCTRFVPRRKCSFYQINGNQQKHFKNNQLKWKKFNKNHFYVCARARNKNNKNNRLYLRRVLTICNPHWII